MRAVRLSPKTSTNRGMEMTTALGVTTGELGSLGRFKWELLGAKLSLNLPPPNRGRGNLFGGSCFHKRVSVTRAILLGGGGEGSMKGRGAPLARWGKVLFEWFG